MAASLSNKNADILGIMNSNKKFYDLLDGTVLRCGFTPVSTVLQKSVRFFIINILLIIIKLPKLKSGKWSGQMFSFLQFPSIRCPLNESETREREL